MDLFYNITLSTCLVVLFAMLVLLVFKRLDREDMNKWRAKIDVGDRVAVRRYDNWSEVVVCSVYLHTVSFRGPGGRLMSIPKNDVFPDYMPRYYPKASMA